MTVVYTTHPDYLEDLCQELNEITHIEGNLVLSPEKKKTICFATDVWLKTRIATFDSISQAAKLLRAEGKYWYLNPVTHIRRSKLIEAELRKLPDLQHQFPLTAAIPPIGCFSLLDKNTLIYSTERWKQPPMGDYQFLEDKTNPPNRAYLKLWEALTLLGTYPQPGETAIDLGASPGGWSYVMQTFGVNVTAVDKAPLDPRIGKLPRIQFLQQSAFALDPEKIATPVDWLLCDVASYPDRTLALVQKWIASGKAKRMIITIKLQGKTDFGMLAPFQDIPHARVIHLCHNKHEVTFFYPATPALTPVFDDENAPAIFSPPLDNESDN